MLILAVALVSMSQVATSATEKSLASPKALDCELKFQRPVATATGSSWFASGLDVADLDGDGSPEVVTANSVDGTFSIFRHVGAGQLALIETLALATGESRDVVLADVTGDGRADLIAAVQGGAGPLVVLAGGGDASFGPPTIHGQGPQAAAHLEVVDLDHDLDLDVVVSSLSIEARAFVFLNDGDGSFAPEIAVDFPLGALFTYFSVVAAGDVDGDDNVDLVALGVPFGVVGLQLGGGDGTFSPGPAIDAGGTVSKHGLSLADIDGDGALDIVLYDGIPGGPELRLLRNDGTGAFGPAQVVPLQGALSSIESPTATALARLDGDSEIDIVTTQNLVPLGDCSNPSGIAFTAFDAKLVDLDLDGRRDVVLASHTDLTGPGIVVVLLNRTAGA